MSHICSICRSEEYDEVRFGDIFRVSARVLAHEKCLLLSVSKDGGRFGLSNITETEVLAVKNRTESMLCDYCGGGGANLGCAHYNCKARYHTGCGIDNKALMSFLGGINVSYCPNHVPEPYPSNSPSANESCIICLEDVRRDGEEFNPVTMLQSPCCLNGWYHWICMQRYAISSADRFKCPLCNNTVRFLDITYWGIHVPRRASSWESASGAYSGIYERIQFCTAPQCPQPIGPSAHLGAFVACNSCGSNPVHTACVPRTAIVYTCANCNLGGLGGYQPPPLEAEGEAVSLQLNADTSRDSAGFERSQSIVNAVPEVNTYRHISLRRRINFVMNELRYSPYGSRPARRARRQTPRSTATDDIIDLTLSEGPNSGEDANAPVSSRTRSRTRRRNQENSVADSLDPLSTTP